MTGNKKWFDKIDKRFIHSIKLGNDTSMTIHGKRDIKFQVQGRTQVISKVLYIPELRTNLLSVGQLQEKGVAIVIQNGECHIYHQERGLIISTPMSANKMFYVVASVVLSNCLQVNS